jgi:proline iminopeptidase
MQSERLPAVPTYLIHGRRDLMCPVESAWALKRKLPHAQLQVLPDATHLAQGESMINALVDATDRMADQLDV